MRSPGGVSRSPVSDRREVTVAREGDMQALRDCVGVPRGARGERLQALEEVPFECPHKCPEKFRASVGRGRNGGVDRSADAEQHDGRAGDGRDARQERAQEHGERQLRHQHQREEGGELDAQGAWRSGHEGLRLAVHVEAARA